MGTDYDTGSVAVDKFISNRKIVSGKELLETPRERLSWVWGGPEQGLFPEGKLIGLASYSGEGKSTLMLHWAAALVDGTPLLGLPSRKVERVLFLTETDEDQVREILQETKVQNPDRIRVCFETPNADQLWGTLMVEAPDVLIIDSLSSKGPALGAHGRGRFEWNDPTHTTQLQGFLRFLRRLFNLKAVVVLLHTVKAARDQQGERIRSTPALEDIRGSGSIAEQMDVCFVLRPSRQGAAGFLHRVKHRKRGVIEKLKFTYEEDPGRYIRHHIELTKNAVLAAIRDGNVSRTTISAALHFRKESVVDLVNKMVEEGSLVELGQGRSCSLVIPQKSLDTRDWDA